VATLTREQSNEVKRLIKATPAGATGAGTIISGTGVPTSGTGSTGQFYLDEATDTLYGPKSAGGAWPVAMAPGAGVVSNYHHVQVTPATSWVVSHGLGFRPNVSIVDSTGREIIGEIDYTSATVVTLSFTAAVSGDAYLS
jgi:hypothetical protein